MKSTSLILFILVLLFISGCKDARVQTQNEVQSFNESLQLVSGENLILENQTLELNGRIEQLNNQLTELEEDLAEKNETIALKEEEISALKRSLGDLYKIKSLTCKELPAELSEEILSRTWLNNYMHTATCAACGCGYYAANDLVSGHFSIDSHSISCEPTQYFLKYRGNQYNCSDLAVEKI